MAAALARSAGGGVEVETVDDVVVVTRSPVGWIEAGVVGGAALLPPLLLGAFLRSWAALGAGALFVVVVVVMARSRAGAMTNLRVDLAATTVRVEHPNRRLAPFLGAQPRVVTFAEVDRVRVRSISMGGRYDPPGARVQLVTRAGAVVTIIDTAELAAGRAVAAELAGLLGTRVEGP